MKITAQKFSDQTGISKALAKRILDLLYWKDYGAQSFDRVMYRLRSMLEKKMIPDLMEKLTDDQINGVIDEMESDDSQDCELARNYSEGQFGVWLFSELGAEFAEKVFVPGDTVDIQIMRAWQWNHQLYWKINVDHTVLKDVVKNFDSNERWIELAVDENHEPNHKALAWYKKLYLQGKDALFATLELTKKGAELLNEGAYKYFSPEIVFQKKDEETGKVQKNLLIGGAFTNRPFFKAMQPLLASEDGQIEASNGYQTSSAGTVSKSDSYILAFNDSKIMNKFLQLIAQFADMTVINTDQKNQLEKAFNQIPENERTDEMQNAFNEVVARFSEDGDDSEQAQADAGAGEDTTDTASDKADTAASDKDTGEDAAADEAKADEPTTVSASENADGTVTIQASEFKTMQAQLAKMVREGRKNELEKKVEAMKFSEWNKVGVVLPKNKNAVVEFALSLSEQQSEKFLKIINDLQTVAASEIGHSNDNQKATVTTEKAEQIKFFTEKLWMTAEQAEQAFSDGASK